MPHEYRYGFAWGGDVAFGYVVSRLLFYDLLLIIGSITTVNCYLSNQDHHDVAKGMSPYIFILASEPFSLN